ncbi:hypothetical protein RSOLAG1IB_10530 [Rhizoctonia solani AG-1 IB]|uniref:Uncharacterized protein n=1 Tax=Thanatephorus cucumeris (strain AG1-IB / isolate 7/3/14) TaxID=1108050 RepID=A0A0B7G176_THACB|nr:hypothetical protein RSOLAG1IB_10530 [Rhizoctonia solani AG-1 IB]
MVAATASLRIGELSNRIGSLSPQSIVEQVNIETLQSILKMSEDIDTYQYFKSQRLVGGCIALMQQIKVEGKASPLSYEYGYLCFRVVLFTLGFHFIYRSDTYRVMQENMRLTPGIEYPLVFSSHVAQAVRAKVHAAQQSLDCDSILGWGSSVYRPLVSREQVKGLIEMLWADRANLLRVLSSTYNPAISGLSFLIWRYIYIYGFRDGSERRLDMPLVKRIMEIHFRCALITTSDQGEPMLAIAEELYKLLHITPGEVDKLFPRSDDSQAIFEAYISRLAPSDARIYAPINITLAIILLDLIVANMGPGLEGLLPTVFELTIERFWRAWSYNEHAKPTLIVNAGAVLKHIKTLLQLTSRTTVLAHLSRRISYKRLLKVGSILLEFVSYLSAIQGASFYTIDLYEGQRPQINFP